jgi:hypothetical protein
MRLHPKVRRCIESTAAASKSRKMFVGSGTVLLVGDPPAIARPKFVRQVS